MTKLHIHHHAREDIERLIKIDINGVSKLLSLLREIASDDDLLLQLNLHDSNMDLSCSDRVNVKKFISQRPRRDLWRLKIWCTNNRLMPYRIIYGFFQACAPNWEPEIVIFATVERSEYNYELNHPITFRIQHDYDQW